MIENLNKAFENRIRLGLMSLLMVNDEMDFNSVKELLQVTDGNLASHTNSLEKLEYITVIKEFVGKKPRTSYKATKAGKEAFTKHIDALEQLLNNR
ncbi:MAG: DNA-binding MarR family transcriptional regulator [Bacteroidia bacterium]|jgi:DNA-binding MarR family transcriptional regulator